MHEGQIIAGRFVIEAEVGAGGMGRVYRAKDRKSDQRVALKLLTSERHAFRFMREGELLEKLQHPAIVRHIAHGETENGQHYIAMEWLDGVSLGAFLARNSIAVPEVARLGIRLAEGLAIAHKCGAVHRDIKPENVFLPHSKLEQAKLLDFGIAHVGMDSLTPTGGLLGTPAYTAPEQVRGLDEVEARADVFALGCLLYECLVGEPAFSGKSPIAILAKVLFEEVPRVGELRPEVPHALEALIGRMLEKQPTLRPEDAAEVLAELRHIDGAQRPAHVRQHTVKEKPSVDRITDAELRFVGVLMVSLPPQDAPDDRATTVIDDDGTPLKMAQNVVGAFGGTVEPVADGSMIVLLSRGQTTAVDRAVQGARCALELNGKLSSARIALAIGRADVTSARPIGEAIDRVATIIANTKDQVGVLADVSAQAVLGGRFVFETGERAARLLCEQDAFATRTLLGRPAPFIGRKGEIAALEAWYQETVSDSRARAVLVTASAGTGKSRLAQELVSRLRQQRAKQGGHLEVHLARSDPTRARSAFALLAPLVRRAMGIQEGEPLELRKEKLNQRIANLLEPEELVHTTTFLGELIGAHFEPAERPILVVARRDPRVLHQHMLRAFCAWLAGACDLGPVVIVLEDLHWGDAPTVKFIGAALRELHYRPLFVLALARSEIEDVFPRVWEAQGAVGLKLGRLNKADSESLVSVALGESLDREPLERIVRVASGNAFFLEELIRAYAEGNSMPDTVLAMVSTRLERLKGYLRRTLRAAAIFGEVFWAGGVAALIRAEESALVDDWLEELVGHELIVRRADARFAKEVEYSFRHGLVRDAAYAMLTDEDRALGHRLAGDWLERSGEPQARVVADHFEMGQNTERARVWLVKAAKQALEAVAFQDVLTMGARAIELGATGDALREAHELRGAAHMGLGAWQQAPGELSAALQLVPKDQVIHQADLRLRLARACFFAFDVGGLKEHASHAFELLPSMERPDLIAEALAGIGTYEQAAGNLDTAADAYRRAKRLAAGRYFSFEAQLLLGLLWRGHFDELIKRGREFVEQARQMNDIFALMVAMPQVGLGMVAQGRYKEGQAIFDRAKEVGRRHETLTLVARALAMSAGYRLDVFDYASAKKTASDALEMALSLNYPATATSMRIDLLLGAARAKDVATAELALPKTAELVGGTEGKGWHGWLFKMRLAAARAELALAKGDAEAGVFESRAVIEQARAHERTKYEISGHVTLGRALLSMERRDEGLGALRTAVGDARRFADPALLLSALLALLEAEGSDRLVLEAQTLRDRIKDALHPQMREAFLGAEALQLLD